MAVSTHGRVQVVEVHRWPERAVPGPSVVVWYGTNRREADAICTRLERDRKRHGHRFYYEVQDA